MGGAEDLGGSKTSLCCYNGGFMSRCLSKPTERVTRVNPSVKRWTLGDNDVSLLVHQL